MGAKIQVDGCENQNIELGYSFWTGAQLMINGNKAPKGANRREMIITKDDGTQVSAYWKQRSFGFDKPNLVVDGKEIEITPPLKWYELVWCGLPIILVFIGGALGAIIGFIAFALNSTIFRSNISRLLQFLITLVISVLAVLLWFFIAAAVTVALN